MVIDYSMWILRVSRNGLPKLDLGIKGMITDEHFIEGWNGVLRIKSRPVQKKKDKID